MYLTRFAINPVRQGAQRLLTSPHALHAAVMAAFPDPSPTAEGRLLWRLDATGSKALLYIASPRRPDLTHLAEQAGWPSLEDSWQTRPYGPLFDRIENDHRYRFRLTANPVRNARQAPGERGKPFGHVTVEQQKTWLLERAERAGFHLANANGEPALDVRDRRILAFSRRETSVTLRIATYEGILEVTDRDALIRALSFGIGRAKGYGCGLLTLATAR